jgi:hypothetical protein
VSFSRRALLHGVSKRTVVGSCEQDNEPSGSIKGGNLTSWLTVSFSRRDLLHGVSEKVDLASTGRVYSGVFFVVGATPMQSKCHTKHRKGADSCKKKYVGEEWSSNNRHGDGS